jgi:CheY-like chemotaxis protein/HPt (histidine-containing phosphotransfer) domain-containing protein
MQRMLMREGARAVLAGDGQQALQYLRAQNEVFDAVLMDVQMPVMDGLAATQAIRRELGLVDLPIITLTAGVLTETRHEATEAGATDFLAKPVDLEELVTVLLRCVAQSALGPEPAEPDPAETLPSIAGLDCEQALLMLGGDRELFLQLLESFVGEFGATAQEVRARLDRGESAQAAERLHALRGAAGYIGARELTQAAETLERSLVGDLRDLVSRLIRFEACASTVLDGARSYLASNREGPKA